MAGALRFLLIETCAQARDRLPELGLRAGANLGGQRLRLREKGERGLRRAGELLGLGAAAVQDAEAEFVVRGPQQWFALVERTARRLVLSLAGIDQREIAQELAFGAPGRQLACDADRALQVHARLVEPSLRVAHDAEVAEHQALQARRAELARHDQALLERVARLVAPALDLMQQAEVAEHVALELPIADLAGKRERRLVIRSRLGEPALLDVQHAEVGERAALAPAIAHPARNMACRFELRDRLVGLALRLQHTPEPIAALPFGAGIANGLRRRHPGPEARSTPPHLR